MRYLARGAAPALAPRPHAAHARIARIARDGREHARALRQVRRLPPRRGTADPTAGHLFAGQPVRAQPTMDGGRAPTRRGGQRGLRRRRRGLDPPVHAARPRTRRRALLCRPAGLGASGDPLRPERGAAGALRAALQGFGRSCSSRGRRALPVATRSWHTLPPPPYISLAPRNALRPQSDELLPLAAAWRHLFGDGVSVPLWIGYTPGATFAVSRGRALRRRPRSGEYASTFYQRAMSTCGLDRHPDPVGGRALERLWRHIFIDGDTVGDADASEVV